MAELQRLGADHGEAVLAFELANRAYFAASISDRGDEFFDQFTERQSALLAEQEAGTAAFHVLVAEDGSVLDGFNLLFAGDGTAELGYRVAQHAAGRRRGDRDRPGAVSAGPGAVRPAPAQGRNLTRERGLSEGTDQGRNAPRGPGRSGPPRRQARHLVPAPP